MKNKISVILIIVLTIIITCFISIKITKLFISFTGDNDYKYLGLKIEDYDIEYSTQYNYAGIGKYKVYKIKNYYSDSMYEYKKQIEKSNKWNRNKFYEYIMKEFYEIKDNETIQIDRDNLYYYNKGGVYAIFDLKNAKLYYFENGLFNSHNNYSEILGIKITDYKNREIYSVRGGLQNDGTDYYTYEFTKDKGKEIQSVLAKNKEWTKKKLDEDILDDFKNNKEVFDIKNGYYHYKKICRTSDENKKHNFTDEEATGWEIGIYDADKNMLYYYWTSI